MTIRDRVVTTVESWCVQAGFDTANALSTLWLLSPQGNSVPFHPQAVSSLIGKLQSEFQPPKPDARDLSNWNPSNFAPSGLITTVDDLVSAVMFAPVPSSPAMFALIGGAVAVPQLREEMVMAIADEVERRLKPVKKASKSSKVTVKAAKKKSKKGGVK